MKKLEKSKKDIITRPPVPVPVNLVTVREAAIIARVNERTIWRMIRLGRIPAWGTRRCYRVSVIHLLPEVKPMPSE
jgi:excisionase family DNA binding protein